MFCRAEVFYMCWRGIVTNSRFSRRFYILCFILRLANHSRSLKFIWKCSKRWPKGCQKFLKWTQRVWKLTPQEFETFLNRLLNSKHFLIDFNEFETFLNRLLIIVKLIQNFLLTKVTFEVNSKQEMIAQNKLVWEQRKNFESFKHFQMVLWFKSTRTIVTILQC